MKRLITGIVTLTTLAVGFWGCNDLSRTTYSGSDYVMFSDTLSMYPVQDSEKWFEIPLVATNICALPSVFPTLQPSGLLPNLEMPIPEFYLHCPDNNHD